MAIFHAVLRDWTSSRDSVRLGDSVACAAPTRQTVCTNIYPDPPHDCRSGGHGLLILVFEVPAPDSDNACDCAHDAHQ